MIDSGTLSVYSAYIGNSTSVYSASSLNPIDKSKDDTSVALNSNSIAYPEIEDQAVISDEAKNLLASEQAGTQADSKNEKVTKTQSSPEDKTSQAKEELTPEQKQQLAELKARDIEVKAHEQAHVAAAAGINASAPSYTYQTGPDGKNYAIGGEVGISFSKSGDPATDIANAQTMKSAALAPAEPSGQDYSVARSADTIIANARKEQSQAQAQEIEQMNSKKAKEGTSNIAQGYTAAQSTSFSAISTSATLAEDASGVPRMT